MTTPATDCADYWAWLWLTEHGLPADHCGHDHEEHRDA